VITANTKPCNGQNHLNCELLFLGHFCPLLLQIINSSPTGIIIWLGQNLLIREDLTDSGRHFFRTRLFLTVYDPKSLLLTMRKSLAEDESAVPLTMSDPGFSSLAIGNVLINTIVIFIHLNLMSLLYFPSYDGSNSDTKRQAFCVVSYI
jgi:hypothetical protein